MPIVPDTKDWTWVLQRPCPECSFDASTDVLEQVPEMVRANAAAWRAVLADERVRQRPSDDVWSALEYGCHVRDVFRLYDERLDLMLQQDDPLFANWDQDATAIEQHYERQSPSKVADELESSAYDLAARFETVSGNQWERTGRRSDGAVFTVDTFARYFVHDPIHHLHDVANGFAEISRAAPSS
jgi:DinB superfamily